MSLRDRERFRFFDDRGSIINNIACIRRRCYIFESVQSNPLYSVAILLAGARISRKADIMPASLLAGKQSRFASHLALGCVEERLVSRPERHPNVRRAAPKGRPASGCRKKVGELEL